MHFPKMEIEHHLILIHYVIIYGYSKIVLTIHPVFVQPHLNYQGVKTVVD